VRYFKHRCFERFAEKHQINVDDLKGVVNDIENGAFSADYGGGLYKQRLARAGGGKSGGYRVLVVFKSECRSVFIYGFEKSDRSNITVVEKKKFKTTAKSLLAMSDEQINEMVEKGKLIEFV